MLAPTNSLTILRPALSYSEFNGAVMLRSTFWFGETTEVLFFESTVVDAISSFGPIFIFFLKSILD